MIHKGLVLEGKHTHTHTLAKSILPLAHSLHLPAQTVYEQQIVCNFKSFAITGANIPLIKEVKWRER